MSEITIPSGSGQRTYGRYLLNQYPPHCWRYEMSTATNRNLSGNWLKSQQ